MILESLWGPWLGEDSRGVGIDIDASSPISDSVGRLKYNNNEEDCPKADVVWLSLEWNIF